MPDREQQIRALLAAATPGPWTISASNYALVFAGSDPWALADAKFIAAAEDIADAELIANAPTDLAWALEEIGRLRAVIDLHDSSAHCVAREAENKRLRIALTGYGNHLESCELLEAALLGFQRECTCGWNAVAKELGL